MNFPASTSVSTENHHPANVSLLFIAATDTCDRSHQPANRHKLKANIAYELTIGLIQESINWRTLTALGVRRAQSVYRRAMGRTIRVRFPAGARYFFSPQRPDRLWAYQISNQMGTGGSFARRLSGRGVNLTTHLHLLSWSRKLDLYLHSPIYLHGTGENFTFYLLFYSST
jgi:hypothetical protein